MPSTLKSAIPAYIDSFSGLVACKVLRVTLRDGLSPLVEVIVTARKSATYQRGTRHTLNSRSVVPRDAVRVRNGKYVIRPYGVQVTE